MLGSGTPKPDDGPLLPVGRWKGYGGDTDYQGATLEAVSWATGLLAKTERMIGPCR